MGIHGRQDTELETEMEILTELQSEERRSGREEMNGLKSREN